MAIIIEDKRRLELKDINEFSKSILRKLEPIKIDEDNLFYIRLSLSEALVNAVKHGNKFDKNKYVSVKIDASPSLIKIEVKDEGGGFNYKDVPLCIDDENIEKFSGRGVFLIENFMDKLEFFDNGSGIRMVKLLKSER